MIIIVKKTISRLSLPHLFKLIVPDKDAIELVEEDETKRLVHAAISKLRPHYKAVVILRGINECTIKETAEILQCSESKVKVDYHRALKQLKNKLMTHTKEVLRHAK